MNFDFMQNDYHQTYTTSNIVTCYAKEVIYLCVCVCVWDTLHKQWHIMAQYGIA